MLTRSSIALIMLFLTTSFCPSSDEASHPGQVAAEPPTLHCLGVRWPVTGDANRNAGVSVQYRRTGESSWKDGYPLFRPHPAPHPENENFNRVPGGWMFAGSIVDLVPDREYEIRLSLSDPDGGSAERILTLRTLAEPREPAGMRVRHVVPPEPGAAQPGSGTRDDPFRGLAAAEAAAEPGDLFLVHAGVYRGTWVISNHGAAGKPIIWRDAGDGEAVIDGNGGERCVSANEVQHVWFEGLTFRNARYLMVCHSGGNTVVRRCNFQIVQSGFTAINGGYDQSRGFFISDNVFKGPSTWPRTRGIEDTEAIAFTGAGNIACYNRISGVADGLNFSQWGRASACDFHNNEISECTDDAIEADEADMNVRIFDNRITNSWEGISGQPVHGGPVYVFRNAMFNLDYSPFKLHNHTSGMLLFHNTSVKAGHCFHIDPAGETVNDIVTRNNLFIGSYGYAIRSTGNMIRCDFDYDGFGGFDEGFALWQGKEYASLSALRRRGPFEQHASLVKPSTCFATGVVPPKNLRIRQPIEMNDLRLRAGSAAIDRGIRIPNFNDDFAGAAPDLGCYELGKPVPHYGPRAVSSGTADVETDAKL